MIVNTPFDDSGRTEGTQNAEIWFSYARRVRWHITSYRHKTRSLKFITAYKTSVTNRLTGGVASTSVPSNDLKPEKRPRDYFLQFFYRFGLTVFGRFLVLFWARK